MAKHSGIESVESVLARMKPENIAKHYIEYKEQVLEYKQEIQDLKTKIYKLDNEIRAQEKEIKRLNNKIKYSGVSKSKLDITAVDMPCGNEDNGCDNCPGRNMNLVHFSEIFYSYHVETDGDDMPEWICGETTLDYKGATITGIDGDFNDVSIANVYEIMKDGKRIYRAEDEAFEKFQ